VSEVCADATTTPVIKHTKRRNADKYTGFMF
jgi:hypothetical protein